MYRSILFALSLFLVGCSGPFSLPHFTLKSPAVATAAVNDASAAKTAVITIQDSDKKLETQQKKYEDEEAALKTQLDDTWKKQLALVQDNDNQIAQLALGINFASQQDNPTNIPLLISYLKSKEILVRGPVLTDAQKEVIQKAVDTEKALTSAQLFTQYKASTELATQQKNLIDQLTKTLQTKTEEYNTVVSTHKDEITKLTTARDQTIQDEVTKAKNGLLNAFEEQKAAYLGVIIKALVAVGIIFLIISILLKSITLGGVSITSLTLAYFAAVTPVWVMGCIVGGIALIVLIHAHAADIIHSFKSIQPTPKVVTTPVPVIVPVPTVPPTPAVVVLHS